MDIEKILEKITGKTAEERAQSAKEARVDVANFFRGKGCAVSFDDLAVGLGDGEQIHTKNYAVIFDLVSEGFLSYDPEAKTWQAVKKE